MDPSGISIDLQWPRFHPSKGEREKGRGREGGEQVREVGKKSNGFLLSFGHQGCVSGILQLPIKLSQ